MKLVASLQRIVRAATAAVFVAVLLPGCHRSSSGLVQGYAEGEYVYVASPLAGELEKLPVQRGQQVKSGDLLFGLESGAEIAARAEAAKRLEEGQARLEDAKKGQRQSEIAAIEAQLNQSRAALALSEKEFVRQTDLTRSGASSTQDFDRARSTRDQDRQRVSQQEADLKTAQLGSRTDQIAAAESNVRALEANLAKADWNLAQKQQDATQSGLVFDTLYRAGEWVAAGRPVVVVLPPENIKVRAFVPENRIGMIHQGDRAQVRVDGVPDTFTGKVSYVSPRAEYTPPVIYSQESRGKLVFMIEIVFEPAVAARLHPGQPVDVQF